MESGVSSGTGFQFGLFEADAARRTLTRKGVRVKIQDKPFHAVILLLEKRGEIVTREELRHALWPDGTYVDFDASLNVILKKLRSAIDDDSENPRFVETVPRQGYRFIAPVSVTARQKTAPVKSETPISSVAPAGVPVPVSERKFKPSVVLPLAVVLLLAGVGWWYFLRNHSVVHAAPKVIAVLPFSNQGAGPDFDYLGYAIGNDLVTDLSYAGSITVRPFSSTAKYGEQVLDPVAIGNELRATHILSGRFRRDQEKLRVDLELVDVARNKPVWKDEVTIAPQEMVGLHEKLAASATQSLLAAMDISAAATDEIPTPKNEQAFELFLHSTMVSLDPEPNQMAIQKLERSVALDGGYAPAWHQLAWRYYIDYHYGSGGQAALAKSLADYKRERELDPNAAPWVSLRVEQGDLQGAYDEISEFARRHTNANVQFSMSYVLRYAGLLDESRQDCEAAFAADPVHGYRSCAVSFILAGDFAGAQKFINLDSRSGFAAILRMDIALRTGNPNIASTEANNALLLGYNSFAAKLVSVCLSHPSQAQMANAVHELETDQVSAQDPEYRYRNAGVLSFCGQSGAALGQLQKAIQGKFCSYPAMDKDPLFDPIRTLPAFAEVRSAGVQCQQEFLAHRKQFDASLTAAR